MPHAMQAQGVGPYIPHRLPPLPAQYPRNLLDLGLEVVTVRLLSLVAHVRLGRVSIMDATLDGGVPGCDRTKGARLVSPSTLRENSLASIYTILSGIEDAAITAGKVCGMNFADAKIERVRYIGTTEAESFYTLYANGSGGWCCDVLDQKDRPAFRYGPFSTRGQAIQAAEWHIDNITVLHRA